MIGTTERPLAPTDFFSVIPADYTSSQVKGGQGCASNYMWYDIRPAPSGATKQTGLLIDI